MIELTRIEPRVMTADEVRAVPRGGVVCVEYFNGETGRHGAIHYAMKAADGALVDEEILIYEDFEKDMTPDAEGDCWRFWTAMPTEEQRDATPWPTAEG